MTQAEAEEEAQKFVDSYVKQRTSAAAAAGVEFEINWAGLEWVKKRIAAALASRPRSPAEAEKRAQELLREWFPKKNDS